MLLLPGRRRRRRRHWMDGSFGQKLSGHLCSKKSKLNPARDSQTGPATRLALVAKRKTLVIRLLVLVGKT